VKTFLALAAAVLLTGCGTLSKPFFRPVLGTNAVPGRVENRTTLATNLVPVVVTNAAGAVAVAIQTNVVATVTPVVIPPTWTVVTNGWEQRPGVSTGVEVAAGVTNIFAPGVGTAASFAFNGIMAVALAFLNRKAKTANETATGLIKGVEDFRQAILMTPLGPKVSGHLVDQIQAHLPAATQAGILLEKLVDQHTGKTGGQAAFVKSLL
jgi:hypothetical protein